MQTMDSGIYTFAKTMSKKYDYLCIRTIVRYIKLFTKTYKKLKQPTQLPPRTKTQRLAHCNFWERLGLDYLKQEMATVDETTVYTKDIPCIMTGYEPREDLKTYEDFCKIARETKFRENNNNNINTPETPENPTHHMHLWTVPPQMFQRVRIFYSFCFFLFFLFCFFLFYFFCFCNFFL